MASRSSAPLPGGATTSSLATAASLPAILPPQGIHCCAFYSSDEELSQLLGAVAMLDVVSTAQLIVVVVEERLRDRVAACCRERCEQLRFLAPDEHRREKLLLQRGARACATSCAGDRLQLYHNGELSGVVCLYDRRLTPADRMLHAICTHPFVVLPPPLVQLVENACLPSETTPLYDAVLSCWLANLRRQNVAERELRTTVKPLAHDMLQLSRYCEGQTNRLRQVEAEIERDSKLLDYCLHQIHAVSTEVTATLDRLQETAWSDDQRELLHLICTSNEHLASIARRKELCPTFGPMEPYQLCRAAVALFAPAAAVKKISVSFSDATTGDRQRLLGDATRVTQILHNLLSNAIKYTAAGGNIDVACEYCADGVLKVVVADTGIGIADAQQEKIFECFHQVDDSSDGTGLGLCICRGLAHEMGGTLTVASSIGFGSAFTLTLPCSPELAREKQSAGAESNVQPLLLEPSTSLSPASSTASSSSPQPRSQRWSRVRVLLAEPMPESQSVLQGMLLELGVGHVQVCDDGLRAVEMAFEQTFDVCLVNLAVPRLAAADAVRLIRKGTTVLARREAPRCFLMDNGDPTAVPPIFDGCLRLPTTMQSLALKMEEILERGGEEAQ